VRNKNARKSDNRVVGLECTRVRPDAVLVTTKDSRIRLFDGVRLVRKFKGHKATRYKTSASFSADAAYVICGSDDGRAPPSLPACCSPLANRVRYLRVVRRRVHLEDRRRAVGAQAARAQEELPAAPARGHADRLEHERRGRGGRRCSW